MIFRHFQRHNIAFMLKESSQDGDYLINIHYIPKFPAWRMEMI